MIIKNQKKLVINFNFDFKLFKSDSNFDKIY